MRRIRQSSICFMVIVAFGCNSNSSTSTEHHHDHDKHAPAEDHAQAEHSNQVTLNKGERWKANPETLQGVNDLLDLTNSYVSGKQPDVLRLQQDMMRRFEQIFTECTMTGEAHEQLHNYLLPLKELIESLDASEATQTVPEIQAYLMDFAVYFE